MSNDSGDKPNFLHSGVNVDYREAFVLDMEMHAHCYTCRQCQVAALRSGNRSDYCAQFKHMQDTIKKAYESLPKYYRDRYLEAMTRFMSANEQVLKDFGVVK